MRRSISYLVSDLGTRKAVNQDSCYVKADEGSAFAAVCDGVGSCRHSEISSAMAVKLFALWYENCLAELDGVRGEELENIIYNKWHMMFEGLNNMLIGLTPCFESKMGSTLSCLLLLDGRYYVLHIGDTRIYRIGSGVDLLTEDHTVTGREIRLGRMTEEAAKPDRKRHVLTKCLGIKEDMTPDFYSGDIQPGDKFLLCSDGFRDKLSDDDILRAYRGGRHMTVWGLERATKALLRRVRREGETDNITAVIVEYGGK